MCFHVVRNACLECYDAHKMNTSYVNAISSHSSAPPSIHMPSPRNGQHNQLLHLHANKPGKHDIVFYDNLMIMQN